MSESSSPRPLPDLSPAEWDVMEVLWREEQAAARDVVAALDGRRDWAPTTIKTLLSRLVAKGAADYVEVGNSYLYRPAVAREEVARREVDEVIERVLEGSAEPVLVGLLAGSRLDPEAIARLRKMLDAKEREAGGRRP